MTHAPRSIAPVNDLERAIVQARAGDLAMPLLLSQLVQSRVVLLMDKAVGPEWDGSATPLVLAKGDGGAGLAVFSAIERANVWVPRFPKFEYALTAEFPWVLQGIQPDTAVLVNPGWAEGFIVPAGAVAEMKRQAAEAPPPQEPAS